MPAGSFTRMAVTECPSQQVVSECVSREQLRVQMTLEAFVTREKGGWTQSILMCLCHMHYTIFCKRSFVRILSMKVGPIKETTTL